MGQGPRAALAKRGRTHRSPAKTENSAKTPRKTPHNARILGRKDGRAALGAAPARRLTQCGILTTGRT